VAVGSRAANFRTAVIFAFGSRLAPIERVLRSIEAELKRRPFE
jgi:hypothetical protein